MASASLNACDVAVAVQARQDVRRADVAGVGLEPRLQRLGERARAVVAAEAVAMAAFVRVAFDRRRRSSVPEPISMLTTGPFGMLRVLMSMLPPPNAAGYSGE